MSKAPTPEEFESLKIQLQNLQQQLDRQHTHFPAPQQNPDMEFLSNLLEQGGEIVKDWNDGVIEARKYESDNLKTVELNRISTADSINKRENITKNVLVIVSITILAGLTYFDKSSDGVLTLIAVIITSVFGNNLSDLFKNINKTFSSNKD